MDNIIVSLIDSNNNFICDIETPIDIESAKLASDIRDTLNAADGYGFISEEDEVRLLIPKYNMHEFSPNDTIEQALIFNGDYLKLSITKRVEKAPERGSDYRPEYVGTEKGATAKQGLKLASIKGENLAFYIERKNFSIGKKAVLVDGVIPNNPTVSRLHCRILYDTNTNTYSVVDLESKNGTYLNNMKLKPNSMYKLSNGDILCIANCAFKVEIS